MLTMPQSYNQVNKDLRTVIDRAPAQKVEADDPKFDLGALASQGLPKDVTPEEIAALAAAAAQIKSTIASTEAEGPADKPSQAASEPQVTAQIEVKAPEAREDKIEAAAIEPKAEAQLETKAEEKIEPVAEKPREVAAEVSGSPSPADVAAAITALEPATYSPAGASSGNTSEHRASDGEPVTMAVASGSATTPAGPRWAAVATALLPEEAAVSLEQEMQKAYAAFAAADVAYAPSTVGVAEPPAATAPSYVEASVAENLIPVVPTAQEEAVPTASPAPSEPAQAGGFAAKNFEVAATPSAEPQPAVPPAPEPSPLQSAEPVAEPSRTAPSSRGKSRRKPGRSDFRLRKRAAAIGESRHRASSSRAGSSGAGSTRARTGRTETARTKTERTEARTALRPPKPQAAPAAEVDLRIDCHPRPAAVRSVQQCASGTSSGK